MADYIYTFNEVPTEDITSTDTYLAADGTLIDSSKINSSFDKNKDFIELHYYSLDKRWLGEIPNNTNFNSNQDSGTANQGTLDSIRLNPEADLLVGGFEYGEVYLSYNFLSDIFTDTVDKVKFFIEEISSDRFEIRLLTTELTDEQILEKVKEFKKELENPDTSEFFVNFGSNNLLLALNIDTLSYREFTSVVVKLYRPLPETIGLKDTLSLNVKKGDSVTYLAESELTVEPEVKNYLKGPNFNINQAVETGNPTEYLTLNDSFSYPVTNSYYEVQSLFEEKGAELSIDHTDYSEFINFSSAKERLENFRYKLNLISTYQAQGKISSNINKYSTGSAEYYDNLVTSIISNFDHYDRFLYYESSSYSWPKSGTAKPYNLLTGSVTGSWYSNQLVSASNYDNTNPNSLLNTVPEYLREDPNNEKYNTFIHMIAQHFDNLWVYSKAVTDKYNADNRLSKGISKDLIEETLKNFGVKLYSSNKSTQDLFKMFTGEYLNTGSIEVIEEFNERTGSAQFITGSDYPTSENNYRKQVYKRLYHNLPLLLKSKGTERSLRALMSSFGVPSFYSSGSQLNTGSLFVNQYGGTISGSYNLGDYQYVTSSLDRIKIDNTGSRVDNTLSRYTSIVKRDDKYANDLNIIEAGYSPAEYVNKVIIESASLSNFDIDQILGDPSLAYSSSYDSLYSTAESYLTNIDQTYNLKDFIRVLKYYDNVLFKSIKDYIPARANANTGIIVKPHLLERSKAKQVKPTTERHNEFSASIAIGTYSGSSGDSFGSRDTYSTNYTASRMTSGGLADSSQYLHEEAKFNGELSGSYLSISTGELNDENVFKYDDPIISKFSYNFVDANIDCEIIFGEYTPPLPTPTGTPTPTQTPTNTPTPTPTVSSDCSFTVTNTVIEP